MLGGGVIAAMQKVYSENRSLGKRTKAKKGAGIEHLTSEQRKTPLKFNEFSKSELADFRMKLQAKKRKEKRNGIIVFILSVAIVFALFYWMFS